MSLLAPRRAHWVRPVDTVFDPGLCGRNVEVGDLPEPHKRQPVGQTRPAHQGARMLTEMLGSLVSSSSKISEDMDVITFTVVTSISHTF